MKHQVTLSLGLILLSISSLFAGDITDQNVIDLVNSSSASIAADAPGTITKIIAGEAPFKSAETPALYTFVYNKEVVIVAHPKASLVGRSYKGKPDVKGKKFRDAIVDGAVANGTGWVTYSYQKPGEKGIHPKKAYYKLVKGSDGVEYIVCSGKYED